VTNFFGSVMETIHTDSAYNVLSKKGSGGAEIRKSTDKSVHDNKRSLLNSNELDQIIKLNTMVNFIVYTTVFQYNLYTIVLKSEGTYDAGSTRRF
jgi:phosphatidylinositol glycan class K